MSTPWFQAGRTAHWAFAEWKSRHFQCLSYSVHREEEWGSPLGDMDWLRLEHLHQVYRHSFWISSEGHASSQRWPSRVKRIRYSERGKIMNICMMKKIWTLSNSLHFILIFGVVFHYLESIFNHTRGKDIIFLLASISFFTDLIRLKWVFILDGLSVADSLVTTYLQSAHLASETTH